MPQRYKHPVLFTRHKHWRECYESWLQSLHDHSGSLQSRYSCQRTVCQLFEHEPNKTPDLYTRAEIEAFIHKPVYHHTGSTPPKPNTQNIKLYALSSFYRYAAQYYVPYRNTTRPLLSGPPPTRGIKPIRRVGRKRRDFSEDELRRLFAAIPRENVMEKRDYALLSMYFWTARRRTEILRIKWGDIFECVFVEDGCMRTGHMYRYVPKEYQRDSFTAELPQPAWDALVDYLRADERLEDMKPETPLFRRYDRANRHHENDPLGNYSPRKIILKYARMAGIEISDARQISPHSLRHTRARLTYKRAPGEKALTQIQQLLGHSSPSTTLVYLTDAENKGDNTAQLLMAEFGRM